MNYLITGATGLIGKKLVMKLTNNSNNTVTVLTRSVNKAAQLFSKVHCISALDLALIEKQDVIINLAGEAIVDKRWTTTQKDIICQSRWQLTEQLSQLITQAATPPSVFISGSAIGIYGRQQKQDIDEEFVDFYPEFSHQVCQRWEELALKAQSNDTRVALLRTGIVLDKDGGALKKMLLPFKLGLGGRIANGQQFMSWIHIDDMVNAIDYIVKNKGLSWAINMTAPYPQTNNQFSQMLAKTLARPCLFPVPKFILKLMLGEMAELVLYGQHVIPKKLLAHGFKFQYPDLTKALEHILNSANEQ